MSIIPRAAEAVVDSHAWMSTWPKKNEQLDYTWIE